MLAAISTTTAAGAAQVYQVGPTRPYPTLASLPALAPGDRVELDPGTYHEVRRWTISGTAANPILIRGMGASRPVFDAFDLVVDGVLPNPRAVFQVEASHLTIENLEFKNARNGNNGAGIRVTSADNVTVRNCKITSCDMGVMSDHSDRLLLESCEIAANGTARYDGYSHNLYLGGVSATLRFCYIHDSLHGQNFKTRAHYTELLYSYLADSQDGEVGLVDGAETTAAHSHAVMIGNVIVSKPRLAGYNSARFIQFGQDSGGQHNGTLFAFNNTFVAGDGRIQFLSANASGSSVVAQNNVFCGSDRIVGTLGGGISGAHNWMPATADVPPAFTATTQGADPGFRNRVGRDFLLTAASACRDQGVDRLSYLDGAGASHSGVPASEYAAPLGGRARASLGRLDLGAFEYSAAAAVLLRGARVGNNFVLQFDTSTTQTCEVQRAADVSGGPWLPWVTNLPGTGDTLQVTDTNAMGRPKHFYRVQVAAAASL